MKVTRNAKKTKNNHESEDKVIVIRKRIRVCEGYIQLKIKIVHHIPCSLKLT